MARYSGSNDSGTGLMAQHDATKTAGGLAKYTGVFICKVIDIVDDRYEGFMYVEIIGEGYVGDTDTKDNRHKYPKSKTFKSLWRFISICKCNQYIWI